jgi:6-phosphogluconolactonase
MEIKKFENKKNLESTLLLKISTCISDAIKKYGDARFLLSGGSTPMNLYSLLSEETIEWEKVKIGLVDERFVPKENLFNNETQIKNNLLKNSAKFATIFGMVYNYENEMLNLKMVNQQYKTFFERIDFTILGMGEDGHTASLFPGDKESEELMNTSNMGVFSTKSPSFPYNRITCSKELIAKSNYLALFINGETKFNVLKNSIETQVPISYFVKNSKNMEIYYSK